MEPSSFLGYLKLPTKVLTSIGLVAAGILFLPASWVAALGLTQIRSQYPGWLGVAILLPAALLITEGIVLLFGWMRERPMAYQRYRTDEFFGLRWRWSWHLGEVANPRAFCRACDLQIYGRIQTVGMADMPTGRVLYHCRCGATDISLPGSNTVEVALDAAKSAEREARKRGLLSD